MSEVEISLSCMDWLTMDSFSDILSGLFSFSPALKWVVPRSCGIEDSHMIKKPILYRQRCEKKVGLLST